MKKSIFILGLIGFSFASCDTTVVEDGTDEAVERIEVTSDTIKSIIDSEKEVINDIKLESGIRIKWFEHGEGEKLKKGDCISIDYKVAIKDNEIVDGNHLLNKESLPFMVGFNMQTPGWEIALNELRVGDFAEIFIPSELARGEQGIEGLYHQMQIISFASEFSKILSLREK
ncbi:MAG: FKBP-type peptidyl-prolyl cis-trans isomerase [Crocinitomicaceae bacterium]